MALTASVAALFIYPVKSCRGVAASAAQVTERGLEHDREWMIVDDTGRFLSQRELPRLALIVPTLSATTLELRTPGREPLGVPLDRPGTLARVTVWRDSLPALDQGDGPAEWLSDWIGRDVRLVRFDPKVRRLCNRTYAGDSGAHTGFADAYPLLVLSQSSLDDLNARLATPLPLNRFRPNVVLAGTQAYDEDYLDEIAAGSIRMKLVKPCTRCQITTTDQGTAERGSEPLATLSTYRLNAALEGVTFGVNAILTAGYGDVLRAGAALECSLRF
ncbi:MAG TPA: MOSC N-terminal beta barrel domain-containing protein [Casimicrobiaceae bacterium]